MGKIIKYVNLTDLFKGHCPHMACIDNCNGLCEQEIHVSDYMEYNEGDLHSTCIAFKGSDDHCDYCGAQMMLVEERHPYGDTTSVERLLICPDC